MKSTKEGRGAAAAAHTLMEDDPVNDKAYWHGGNVGGSGMDSRRLETICFEDNFVGGPERYRGVSSLSCSFLTCPLVNHDHVVKGVHTRWGGRSK